MEHIISICLMVSTLIIILKIKDHFINLKKEIYIGKSLERELDIAIKSKSNEISHLGGLTKLKVETLKQLLLVK